MLAPSPSAARLAANRRNAQLSTGPRTEAGKERSRGNAVKHGLTGAGIALPVEDEAAVAARFAAVQEELAPRTVLGAVLADQVALMSIRLERSARHEAAAISQRMQDAQHQFDESRRAEANARFATIETDPINARISLLTTPEGIERLVEALLGVMGGLVAPSVVWTAADEARVATYLGPAAPDSAHSRLAALSAAIQGDGTRLDPREFDPIPGAAGRRDWAINQLVLLVDAEVGRLCEHRATLDLAAIERDRLATAELALFDPGPEAALARRYEAAASRTLHRSLSEFRVVEAAAIDAGFLPPRSDLSRPTDHEAPAPPPAVEPAPPDPIAPETPDLHQLRAALGSFGTVAAGRVASAAEPPDDADRRRDRPRLDRIGKRHRRRN